MSALPLIDHYRSIGEDPFECSVFDCQNVALYVTAPEPCGPECDHMHGLGFTMCEEHARGKTVVGTTGD